MTKSLSKRGWSRAALAVMLGAVLVVGFAGTGARAADDDDDDIDSKIFKTLMRSLGLRQDGGIDYRERAPLVLPPGHSMPPPESQSPQAKAADWPVDADITRARKRKAERKHSNPEPEDARPLLPNQYSLPGRASRGGDGTLAEDRERPSSPYELGSKSVFSKLWGSKEEYSTFTAEPPRQRLIDPPSGYRTPSPNQPYGVGQSTWAPAAPVDRNEPVR